jgi:hypothetical protein
VNLFFNYTVGSHSFFDQSRISFSINNLFNDESVLDVASSNSPVAVDKSTYFATTAPSPLDQLSMTSARSYMVSIRIGIFPGHTK